MQEDISRRGFLAGLLGLLGLAGGLGWLRLRTPKTEARIHGPNLERGHAIWQPHYGSVSVNTRTVDTAIIGGGISGLSAAWYLQKKGKSDFALFELEDRTAGNSQWGENRVGRYPWGAHYLPTPGSDAVYVRELLSEMGVLANGKFSEEALVHEPEERLFIYGTWQTGLVPWLGARVSDREQMQRFLLQTGKLRYARGSDGKRAFTIPLSLSSRDEKFRRFDRMTAAQYLEENRLTSQRLAWYIDYVLRDEYGSNRHNTSAWALLHYFSARSDAHNLVWPEGNGFIAEYLHKQVFTKIAGGMALRKVEKEPAGYRLYFTNHREKRQDAVVARNVIFAAPKFILPYVYPAVSFAYKVAAAQMVYSPWLTVNLLVNQFAQLEPAWDNVTFGSKSLGYVVAEHQRSGKLPHARTLTFFHAFDHDDTLQSRRRMLAMSPTDIAEFALAELRKPHPEIDKQVEDIGAYRWAHAMVRPVPGFLAARTKFDHTTIDRNFYAAHSDISGMSNFEEAQFNGVEAARRVLGM